LEIHDGFFRFQHIYLGCSAINGFLCPRSRCEFGHLAYLFISRGKRNLAPILGFVEVFIWITVVSQIVSHAHNLLAYLAYAAGFAAGNFVGMYIEDRLAIGTQIIRIIVQNNSHELTDNLHSAGYGVTCVAGQGTTGPVTLVYTIVKRKDMAKVLSIIQLTHPNAFLTIEDLRSTQAGIFPASSPPENEQFFPRKFK
jgi:uncharacterized protein YebE (UPF0316 family)